MTNSERYKDALEKIDKMNVGPKTKEVIRRAFHPDETCPRCKGVGKIPQQRTPDCGDCVSYSSTGPYSGECHKGHDIADETDPVCWNDFVNRFPTESCPSCGGKSIEYDEEVAAVAHDKQDFSAVEIDID